MTSGVETLGLIAGNRTLPLLLARQARQLGVKRLVAVAFEGETDPQLAGLVDHLVWIRVGQLGALITAFKQQGVRHCVMAGQIAPRNLFQVRLDLPALRLLLQLKERNAHTIFGAVAAELHRHGIEVLELTPWLEPWMPQAGFRVGPKLTRAQRDDVAFGFRMAKEIARLDIGQTVVVKAGTVLAVEGFEGTDPCLARGGALAGPRGGAVAVKVAKPNHDLRFDLPCVGAQTIETCLAHRIAVLAFEAGRTVLLEQDRIIARLRGQRLTVLATEGAP